MSTINIHIYPSPFKHESRMLKETKSIADAGLVDKIFIVALWEPGLKQFEKIDDKREVWRVPLKTGRLPSIRILSRVINLIEWQIRIFFRFRQERVVMFNCHSLKCLPIGVLFKIALRSKLIYDTHELETERNGWSAPIRIISKVLERMLMPFIDVIFVVSDSIGEWYRANYPFKEVCVVKNVPYRKDDIDEPSDILKQRFHIRDDEILFIYQGALGRGRCVELLLSIFSSVDKKKHIVFMGYGPFEKIVKKYENKYSNIHFQPAVEAEEVLTYTKSADVGLYLIENTCLSYQLTVGNKVYEYILSGLPLIASDYPDVWKIINEYDCGWTVSPDEGAVRDVVEKISKEAVEEKRRNTLNCRHNFGWDIEEKNMLKVYDSILGESPSGTD